MSLLSRLVKDETIKKVYLDKNGGWLFVPNRDHAKELNREEAIEYAKTIESNQTVSVEEGSNEDYDLLKEEIDLLNQSNSQYESQLSDLVKENDSLKKSIQSYTEAIQELSDARDSIAKDNAILKKNIADLKKKSE